MEALVSRTVCEKQAGIPMKNSSLMGMFEVVTGCGWWLRLVGTVMVTWVVRVEEFDFPVWVPFEVEQPSSMWRPM